MLERIRQLFRRQGHSFHRAQGGAIILLVLAAFLILVLASLTQFDAGQTAQEEIQVQTAADSAAYSQSVVKARSMNKITYANTAKRMFFSYFVTYVAGAVALVTSTSMYCSSCNIYNWYACYRCGVGVAQGFGEIGNYFSNVRPAAQRASSEFEALDNFQEYLVEITPWWSYMENVLRGHYNGATATTSWPPPPATLPSAYNSLVSQVMNFDDTFDTNISSYLPDPTEEEDSMPLTKRDPDGFFSSVGEYGDYCLEFTGSPEHIIPAAEHVILSDGGGWDPQGISTDSQTLGIFLPSVAVGCVLVATMGNIPLIDQIIFDDDDLENVLDWRVDDGGFWPDQLDENDWMQRTSNITLAYKATQRSGERRNKFDGILNDHDESPSYQSEGTWSIARSEIVWGESAEMTALNTFLPGAGSVLDAVGASNYLGGPMVGLRGGPHMWAPRWTGRLRPVYLPGETLGQSQIAGDDIGLGHVFIDSLPHMAITSTLSSLVSGDFDFFAAVDDMFYMYAASGGFSADRLEGIER